MSASRREEQADHVEPDLQAVSFRLNNELYALNILDVQEIIKPVPITIVPLAPAWIAGVINLRGQILPLIRLSKRLGLSSISKERSARFIITRHRERRIGLVVDEVLEVLRLYNDSLELPPAHLEHREYIHHVSKEKGGIAMILNLQKILTHSTHSETPEEAL